MWWRKVRKADIPQADRELFERYGESVIGSIVAGGLSRGASDLAEVYKPGKIQDNARNWLAEQRHQPKRRERRVVQMEYWTLGGVILGLILQLLDVLHIELSDLLTLLRSFRRPW
jgi:hypothetical protein